MASNKSLSLGARSKFRADGRSMFYCPVFPVFHLFSVTVSACFLSLLPAAGASNCEIGNEAKHRALIKLAKHFLNLKSCYCDSQVQDNK